MKRNIDKTLNEYFKIVKDNKQSAELFVGECNEILNRADCGFDAIAKTFKVGFVVGYRYAKKEMKQCETN